jgi:hypothetical protein
MAGTGKTACRTPGTYAETVDGEVMHAPERSTRVNTYVILMTYVFRWKKRAVDAYSDTVAVVTQRLPGRR